ncbi:SRPBCC family protein [Sandaracinus amylolyticus]|uniref:SRPBCC family protein n=1 Tax=Sandaracinus amylolyticus TaxID=927083 RepID=UPI001F3C6F25|nr:SRPBCC domain-containing protein [Sandaracinus amylolyticus]UJR84422.1 Hypothetical protein I5071_65010 [Sandaracinus amylolyticus]
MKRDIHIERTYPHPPEIVWRALTDPALIAEWLMPNDFRAELGHRFTMRTDPAPGFDGIVKCEVLELDAPRRMRWSWKGGPIDTVVTFELEPAIVFARPATTLKVAQTGFEGLDAVLVSFVLGAGNRAVYGRHLPYVLDRLAAGETIENVRETCAKERGRWWWISRAIGPIVGRRKTSA